MKKIKKKSIKLVTHDGSFHADDIFAAAALSIMLSNKGETFEIIRTRDQKIINNADYVFDLGRIYKENLNRFDHHQTGGAGEREGIPYSSFGLVWKKFGGEITGNKKITDIIERKLVMPVDVNDNGVDLYKNNFPNIFPYTYRMFLLFFYRPRFKILIKTSNLWKRSLGRKKFYKGK